jgi:hypothetical protein
MVRRWVRTCPRTRVFAGIARRGRPEQWVALKGYRGNALAHEWHVTQVAVELVKLCGGAPDLSWTPLAAPFGGPVADLSFVLTSKARKKSLLFFVEIDCGTEPVRRVSSGTDVGKKLTRYMESRATGRYCLVLENTGFSCRGFRVLIVAMDAKRGDQLRRLARSLPGDFIWVTDMAQLAEDGMAGRIWTTGRNGEMKRSILGSLAEETTQH